MSSELTAAELVALTATSDHRGGFAVGSAGFPVNTAGHETGTRQPQIDADSSDKKIWQAEAAER